MSAAEQVTAENAASEPEQSTLHTEPTPSRRVEAWAAATSKYRSSSVDEGPLDRLKGHVLGAHVKTVFRCWVVAFALVGTQMSWVLRPFIGRLNEDFMLFAPRESSFFKAVWAAIQSLF